MAGVVSSEGVFDSELTFTLPSTHESESLQELIDSELALRIQETPVLPKPVDTCFTQEFLTAEREHTNLCIGSILDTETAPQESNILILDSDHNEKETVVETDVGNETIARSVSEPDQEIVVLPGELDSSTATDDEQLVIIGQTEWEEAIQEERKTFTTVIETREIITIEKEVLQDGEILSPPIPSLSEHSEPSPSVQESSDSQLSSPPVLLDLSPNSSPSMVENSVKTNGVSLPTNEEEESSWTTVEEAARDMLDFSSTIDNIAFCQSEETETIITEKKTKKKKTITEGGEVTSVKVKKTKKTKKSDEKENHISVITNGHNIQENESHSISTVDEKELSNVCVKELKLTYVSEAAKSYNVQSKPSEEPVLPTVPIRELRRSFGDIHRACEDNDFIQNNVRENQLRARSLGDLRRDERKPVVTGVNVKELAAKYWMSISVEKDCRQSEPLSASRLDKSSFSKFDQLSKNAVFHVRSSDSAKAQKTFSQSGGDAQGTAVCKSCGKTVFAMEQIKAERAVWHKNCFRCTTCNKQLTVDIYSSHEGELYCKPHFKELFKPKAVVDTEEEPVRRRKPELIIRENQPVELPPDVVRASDKADLGLEELSSLNVKSRFQVFEKHESTDEQGQSLTQVNVKRSPSILSKLARFQKKGMDIGVTDEALNGFKYEETTSEEEDEEEDVEEEKGVIKCRKIRERPMSFSKLDDVKRNWECGQSARKDELREERKQEIQHIRSRLFMGKQGKMKEMYEQAVAESEGRPSRKELDTDVVKSEKAKAVREKFEKGEAIHSDSDEEKDEKQKLDEDMSVFEEGISKKSRSIFLEMDANISKSSSTVLPTPKPITREQPKTGREVHLSRQTSEDVVKASDPVEDVTVKTADLSSKFRFFETYKAPEVRKKTFRITPPRDSTVKSDSPEREVYRDPDVIRSDDKEDESVVLRSHTASKMLSLFRQMEEQKEVLPDGPKAKKCFTPPPDYKEAKSGSSDDESEEGSEEEDEEEEYSDEEQGIVRSSHKIKDEFLEQAHTAARAKELAAKFEQWEPEKQSTNNAITMLETDVPSIDSTKSLRARFESLKTEQPKEKQRPKVNRFVDPPITNCASCQTKVYPLEKVEASGKSFHKACFRCTQCNTILRMDSYTLNNGQLYCMPHFKQLFIAKGNYDEGFGLNQHKRKWEAPVNGSS